MNSLFDFAEIGLETRDRRVYETLLANPGSSLRKIAADTGINRGSVYESMKKLTEQGLVSSLEVGKQRRYTAAEPASIIELIRERRDELIIAERQAGAYVKQLQAKPGLRAGSGQFAQFYEGTEGVAAILRDVIGTCRNLDTPSYRAISTKDVREFIYENFRNFTQRRIAEKIAVRVIAVGIGGSQDKLAERRWLESTRSDAPNCYTLIYGNKTAFINLGEGNTLSAIVIDNSGVGNLQKELFDRLWDTLA
jgi:sugar-specific transcriptional regulator TrmB